MTVHYRGHTVIEMLLVVGILAVVASVSVARFKSFALRKDAQHLMALMNYAQRRAVESGHQYVLNINSTTNSFCVNPYEQSFENVQTADLRDECLRSWQLNDATHVEAAVPRMVFYPDSHMTVMAVKLHDRDHSVILSTAKQWGKVTMVECGGDCRDL